MPKFEVAVRPVSLRFHAYYDWLATGMSMLADEGRVDFRVRRSAWMPLVESHKHVMTGLRKYAPRLAAFMDPSPDQYLLGEVRCADKKVRFLFDIDDSPILYREDMFDRVDLYFKCQCPREITPAGFPLNSRVRMPFPARVLAAAGKIRPAMLGRPLSRTLNFRRNLAVLKRWEDLAQVAKTVRFYALYTFDRGYPASDAPGEGTLVRDYGRQIHHPERKRGELVKWMKERFPKDVDLTIWKSEDPALRGPVTSDSVYPSLVARSMFNINICGYGRSIPFRFIDTFLVGSSVISDEIAMRWYEPFEKDVEVFDCGRLGYELPEDADWSFARERMVALYDDAPKVHAAVKERVLENYRRKWHPVRLAEYVIREAEKLM
jgi:hypothetical protein